MRLFDYDSGLMQALNKVANLMILNLLALVCCIPIITIGASITAVHYSVLKMKRGTDDYPVRNFFKSFKENFKQSTILFLLELFLIVISVLALFIMSGAKGTFNSIVSGVILADCLIIVFTTLWVYPLQARFVNKITATIKNAFMFSLRYIHRTLFMLIAQLLPIALMVISFRLFPVVLLFGISVPAFLNVYGYDKIFVQLEERIMEQQSDGQEEKELGPWEAAEKRAEEERERERKEKERV